MRRVTSGLLPVPSGSDAVQNAVHVLLSSFSNATLQVPFQVNRLAEDGVKIQIRSGVFSVPPRGASRIVLDDVAGETIEVNLELPTEQIDPSISLVRIARPSDTADLTEWVSPDDFTVLPPLEVEPPSEPPTSRITSGLFPVDVSRGEFAPPFRYQVILLVSNFSNAPGQVMYELNWAREIFEAKTQLHQGDVIIEPGTGARIVFDDVAGKTIEVNLTVQGEGLVPSLAVLRVDPSDQSTELIMLISAQDFAAIPTGAASA